MAKKTNTEVFDIKIKKANNGYFVEYLEHTSQETMFGTQTIDMIDKVNVFESWDSVISFLEENELAA